MSKKISLKNKTRKNKDIKKKSLRSKTMKGGVLRKTFRDSDNLLLDNETKRYLPEYTDYLIGNEIDDPSKQIFFKLGTHVVKDYYQIQMLGQGSYGSVVTAKKSSAPREKYVVKVSKIPDKKKQIVFYNEVYILKYLQNLCNQFVVCFVEAFTNETKDKKLIDTGYLVLENLEGYITLDEYIKTPKLKSIVDNFNQEKSDSRLILILSNLLEGLFNIHLRGVIHRDIKPANIMIHPETYNIKYIDFGLSCYSIPNIEKKITGLCIMKSGTPNTFDPKLYDLYFKIMKSSKFINEPIEIKNKIIIEHTQKSDLWSVGIVMFYILLQKSPTSYFKSKIKDFNSKSYESNLSEEEISNISTTSLFSLFPFYISDEILSNEIMTPTINLSFEIVRVATKMNEQRTTGYFSSSLYSLLNLDISKRSIYVPDDYFL